MYTAASFAPQSAKVIPFPAKKNTESKKRAVKSSVSNSRPHEAVQPIKDVEDIAIAKDYFKDQPRTPENARNYMMFVVNINNAVRISDLLKLKIGDVLTKEGVIKEEVYIRESKTGKTRYIFLGKESRKAIRYYLKTVREVRMNDYLFEARKSNGEGRGKAISRQQAWNIMHKLGEVLSDITHKEYHLGTHSMRKTFGYQKIKQNPDDPMIVAEVSEMYNHSNMKTTYRYLGIDYETKKRLCTENEL